MLDTGSGPVVLLGCAHAGIVEILEDIVSKSGHSKLHAVIGGTHLESASEEYLNKTIEILEKYDVALIGTSHCTGFKRSSTLAAHFKEKFIQVATGTVLEF
ncbi:MAG TPA: MBL fold metallo-hydrolase, partial [Spirochaetota bacterium]|nr:MBL fold metallo-hydrolase [Spirochaetota bacterium]